MRPIHALRGALLYGYPPRRVGLPRVASDYVATKFLAVGDCEEFCLVGGLREVCIAK